MRDFLLFLATLAGYINIAMMAYTTVFLLLQSRLNENRAIAGYKFLTSRREMLVNSLLVMLSGVLWLFVTTPNLFAFPPAINVAFLLSYYAVTVYVLAITGATLVNELKSVISFWMREREPPDPDHVNVNAREATDYFVSQSLSYNYINELIAPEYFRWVNEVGGITRIQVRVHANCITGLMMGIETRKFMTRGDIPLGDLLEPTLTSTRFNDYSQSTLEYYQLLDAFGPILKSIRVRIAIPEALRTEHMQILANPGHGKSTLLTQMFFDDLKTDAGIVVIDSQGDLINELAKRVPADRLILVDPQTCPPALNVFARKVEGEQGITNALSLFEYIFGSLGVTLTGKQEMVYRYLSRLCMVIPNGSINVLRDMLLPRGTEQYQEHINQMGDNAQAFFRQFQQEKNNQYSDTRQEVLTKLLKVLESDTFSAMLGAETMALDIPKALSEGKVLLVSTAKNFLDKGSSLLGRIFVAQVMQAVRNRQPGDRRRVYLYIDEFADYAEDSSILLDCFSQGRKYELGMIVAHQNLGQLTPKLADTMSSSTAIKFAGGVSSEDSRRMSNQMRTRHELIDAQPKGTFLAYFKDMGVQPWKVQFGFIDKVPVINDIKTIQADMRAKYGATKVPAKSAFDPDPVPPKDDDFGVEQESWGS